MPFRRVSEEALFPEQALVEVSTADVRLLKQGALANARRRIRLCAHLDVGAAVQEMLIVHSRGGFVRPHKHPGKSVSFHVFEGSADLVTFTDDGAVRDFCPLGEYGGDRLPFVRMNSSPYYMLLVRSELFVFHETTVGPFDRAHNEFPAWAPDEADRAAQLQYMNRIEAVLQDRLQRTSRP